MELMQALKQLDPNNDEHWTADGLPRVDVVTALLGKTVGRQDITNAAPELTREAWLDSIAAADSADPADEESAADETDDETEETEEAEEEVPEDDPDYSILDQPIDNIMRSKEGIAAALAAVSSLSVKLLQDKRAIEGRLAGLYEWSNLLSRAIERIEKQDPNYAMRDIQSYLQRSNQTRANRANAARRFIASGTTARDVADQLNTKSKIDQVMGQRKPALGAGRPPVRPPMHNAASGQQE